VPLTEMFSLDGKVAVVTGGAGHLGYPISLALAEAGAKVYIGSTNYEKCCAAAAGISQKTDGKAKGVLIDIRSTEAIQKSFADIALETGKIDILVNNAFYSSGQGLDMAERDWQAGLDGTAGSVFRTTREVVTYMEKAQAGSIINIASMYGLVSPDPAVYPKPEYANPPNYGAGKAAVIQFSRYAACHLAPKGIRVNSVSPGPFPTIQVQNDQEFMAALEKKVPLGRIGRPQEIKGIIVFLASEAASYVTGANFCVDGGWTAW